MNITKFFRGFYLVCAVLCFLGAFLALLFLESFIAALKLLIAGIGALLTAVLLKEILNLEERVQILETRDRSLSTAIINIEKRTQKLETKVNAAPFSPNSDKNTTE